MQINEKVYPISWGNLAALECASSADKTPLLAFHGWLDNAASFLPLMRIMPHQSWKSFDLAGHGHSDPRPEGNMRHFLSYVQDIWEVMTNLESPQFDLIGHSLGSGIAAMIASTWPDKIRKVVLVDGMGPFSKDSQDWLQTYANSFKDLQEYNNGKQPATRSFEKLAEATEYLIKRRRWSLENSSAALLAERQLSTRNGKLIWSYDPQLKLASPLPMTHTQVNQVYQQISAPVLLLRFSDGPMFLDYIPWQERIDALKNLEIVDFTGGHHLHMDQPDQVADAITDFLNSS